MWESILLSMLAGTALLIAALLLVRLRPPYLYPLLADGRAGRKCLPGNGMSGV
jgi:hypothetical protein